MADRKKRLVFGILDFLQTSIDDGTIRADDKESVEVAMQCVSEAFDIDPTSPDQQSQFSLKPASLIQILDVYLKTQERSKAASASAPAPPPSSSTTTPAPSASSAGKPSAEDKAAAEDLKTVGNKKMAEKDYEGAIKSYTDAIEKDGTRPIYWSNRAAAYSQAGRHEDAISDAKKAAEVDPKFSKAYSRLGHALFSLGQYKEAVEAYNKGLELDPNNPTMKSSLETARSRLSQTADADGDDTEADDILSRADGAGNGAGGGFPGFPGMGGGGGGGMPDLASLMNNPMMMQMAQQMMQNGGLEQLMQNPMLRNMAASMGRGGGLPNQDQIEQMMQDPTMRRMAEQMGRGRGGAGSGGGGGGMYS